MVAVGLRSDGPVKQQCQPCTSYVHMYVHREDEYQKYIPHPRPSIEAKPSRVGYFTGCIRTRKVGSATLQEHRRTAALGPKSGSEHDR